MSGAKSWRFPARNSPNKPKPIYLAIHSRPATFIIILLLPRCTPLDPITLGWSSAPRSPLHEPVLSSRFRLDAVRSRRPVRLLLLDLPISCPRSIIVGSVLFLGFPKKKVTASSSRTTSTRARSVVGCDAGYSSHIANRIVAGRKQWQGRQSYSAFRPSPSLIPRYALEATSAIAIPRSSLTKSTICVPLATPPFAFPPTSPSFAPFAGRPVQDSVLGPLFSPDRVYMSATP